MIVVRLARHGGRHDPFYHVVVANSRSPRNGRFLEKLGFYNPIPQGKAEGLKLDLERLNYWVSVGAQMSDRVRSLVKIAKTAK